MHAAHMSRSGRTSCARSIRSMASIDADAIADGPVVFFFLEKLEEADLPPRQVVAEFNPGTTTMSCFPAHDRHAWHAGPAASSLHLIASLSDGNHALTGVAPRSKPWPERQRRAGKSEKERQIFARSCADDPRAWRRCHTTLWRFPRNVLPTARSVCRCLVLCQAPS
jgi:hypothetical protein